MAISRSPQPRSQRMRPQSEASSPVRERTLTRRELRAMLQAQEANQAKAGHPDQVVPATVSAVRGRRSPPGAAASEPPTT